MQAMLNLWDVIHVDRCATAWIIMLQFVNSHKQLYFCKCHSFKFCLDQMSRNFMEKGITKKIFCAISRQSHGQIPDKVVHHHFYIVNSWKWWMSSKTKRPMVLFRVLKGSLRPNYVKRSRPGTNSEVYGKYM